MNDSPYNPNYLQGIASFNRRAYFDAHDCWERWWIEEGRPADGFAKGLVQAAVAMHHLARGNVRGCQKLLDSSRQVLSRFPAGHQGLDIDRLLDAISRCCQQAVDGPNRTPDPAAYPQIELVAATVEN
jgi:predicted metal-dependent hydrolase